MPRKTLLIVFVITLICFAAAGTALVAAKPADKKPKIKTTPAIDRVDFPTLYPSDPSLHGEAVWMLQARLRELGYELKPDGCYSPATAATVRLYQIAQGMKEDGVVTTSVWKSLMESTPAETCLTEPKSPPKPGSTVIVIDVATRKLTVFKDGKSFKEYPVAVGKSETPTPLGEWRVVHKGGNWGNGFGTRWMGLNVPWGIYGIHGTNKPYSIGTYASHGCIRMFNQHVEQLYPQIPAGTTVRIVNNGRIFPSYLKPTPLKKGSTGQKVVFVQARLKEIGIVLDRADGRFGNMTALAVKYYQLWHDLPVTGEVDESTYRSLGLIK